MLQLVLVLLLNALGLHTNGQDGDALRRRSLRVWWSMRCGGIYRRYNGRPKLDIDKFQRPTDYGRQQQAGATVMTATTTMYMI